MKTIRLEKYVYTDMKRVRKYSDAYAVCKARTVMCMTCAQNKQETRTRERSITLSRLKRKSNAKNETCTLKKYESKTRTRGRYKLKSCMCNYYKQSVYTKYETCTLL